jgi:uncharacterized integral membrane protein
MNTSDDIPEVEGPESTAPAESVAEDVAGDLDAAGQVPRRVFVGTGLFWGLVVGVVVAVVFIVLAAQNTADAQVRFMGWDATVPLIAVILVSLLAGVVLDEIVGLVYRARRRRILQQLEELRVLRSQSSSE